MQGAAPKQIGFDPDEYVTSWAQVRRLKLELSTTAIEHLAREVIRQLVARAGPMGIEFPSDGQIEHFCYALISEDDDAASAFVRDIQTRGASIETVYLRYLAAAARRLGEWWEEDHVSFLEVTLGAGRIYAIMRALRGQLSGHWKITPRTAVFAAAPGETHLLGIRMAADLFRKEGWSIDLKLGLAHDDLVAEIVEAEPAVVGISAGGVHALEAVSRLVVALRIACPRTFLFLGGNLAEVYDSRIDLLGFDGVATDMDGAKRVISALWDRSAEEGQ